MTKAHCHLCGATLRRPEQFYELVRPNHNDVIILCRDETRCLRRAAFDPPTLPLAIPESTRPRSLRERHIQAEAKPIRVHQKDGGWQVDYGSYAHGSHLDREDAIETATAAATREHRKLTIEDAETAPD